MCFGLHSENSSLVSIGVDVFFTSQFGRCVASVPVIMHPGVIRPGPGDLPHLTGPVEKAREGALMIPRGIQAAEKDSPADEIIIN